MKTTKLHDCPLCPVGAVELSVEIDPGEQARLTADPANSVEPTVPSVESIGWLGWIGEPCGCDPDEIIETLWPEIESEVQRC